MSQVRTSIYFDSELFDQIHIFADLAGQSLKDFVNDAAMHYIETLRSDPSTSAVAREYAAQLATKTQARLAALETMFPNDSSNTDAAPRRHS